MALIYEHWRSDTNECFYVGASRMGEIRANDFSSRNNNYKNVLNILKSRNIKPYSKIIWDNLEDDCVSTYEKIRISFQRSILGNKLTNIANGGDGFNINWTKEMRALQSAKSSYINNLPENLERNRKIQKIAQNRPEVIQKKKQSAKIAMNKPEVIEKLKKVMKEVNDRPGFLEKRGKKISEAYAKVSQEKKSQVAKQRQEKISPEKKSEIARKRIKMKTPEQLSEVAKKVLIKVRELDESARKLGLPTRAQKAGKTIQKKYLAALESGELTFREKGKITLRKKNEELKALGLPTSHEKAAKKAWETRRRKQAERLLEERGDI